VYKNLLSFQWIFQHYIDRIQKSCGLAVYILYFFNNSNIPKVLLLFLYWIYFRLLNYIISFHSFFLCPIITPLMWLITNKPTIYNTWGGHTNHYSTDVVNNKQTHTYNTWGEHTFHSFFLCPMILGWEVIVYFVYIDGIFTIIV
jgi:hypothetical protein